MQTTKKIFTSTKSLEGSDISILQNLETEVTANKT